MHNFAILTEDASVADPVWSQPRHLSVGVMLNKPTVLSSGEWLMPTCLWRDERSSRILRSTDHGATFEEFGSATIPKYEDRNGDENMIIERRDGTLWMLVRTGYGLGESFSRDGGKTWTDVAPSTIRHAESRFFIRRLASGRLLMVRHAGTVRSHLTAYLSEDDGVTWSDGLLIDDRGGVFLSRCDRRAARRDPPRPRLQPQVRGKADPHDRFPRGRRAAGAAPSTDRHGSASS